MSIINSMRFLFVMRRKIFSATSVLKRSEPMRSAAKGMPAEICFRISRWRTAICRKCRNLICTASPICRSPRPDTTGSNAFPASAGSPAAAENSTCPIPAGAIHSPTSASICAAKRCFTRGSRKIQNSRTGCSFRAPYWTTSRFSRTDQNNKILRKGASS